MRTSVIGFASYFRSTPNKGMIKTKERSIVAWQPAPLPAESP
jgi:hypothetical protein